MHDTSQALESAAWSAAYSSASPDELALLEADPDGWLRTLERLLDDTEDHLDIVCRLKGPERQQVVADLEDVLARLEVAYERLNPSELASGVDSPEAAGKAAEQADRLAGSAEPELPGEVQLQASWSAGQVVVWAAGRGSGPAGGDELSDRLEAIGGPPLGWSVHPALRLPSGADAAALSIPIADALGWLVTVGKGLAGTGVGQSVTWLGRVAIAAVGVVARGGVVPTLHTAKRPDGRRLSLAVRWVPALLDSAEVLALAAAMPAPVIAFASSDARAVVQSVVGAVVDAIVSEAARRIELPAPPPITHTATAVSEAVLTRLDGSPFETPVVVGSEVARRLDRWSKVVAGVARTRLVVQLEAPDRGDVWFLSVLGPDVAGRLVPVEFALADTKDTRAVADELVRLEGDSDPDEELIVYALSGGPCGRKGTFTIAFGPTVTPDDQAVAAVLRDRPHRHRLA